MKRLIVCLLLAAPSFAQTDVFTLGTRIITTSSLGQCGNSKANGGKLRQHTDSATGPVTGIDIWRGSNGLEFQSGYTSTAARLTNPAATHTLAVWNLDRYQASILAMHRFGTRRVAPYAGIGVSAFVLWGGDAPAHSGRIASGFDGLVNLATIAGAGFRITPRLALRVGLEANFGNASTYGDQHYTPSPNATYEPQIGLVWRLPKTHF